ncbi:MAG: hypothetical protein LC799_09900 [Actinobacteria bacterium]|nr:hypothetical protein [Actinomycetota bacterium]
MHRREGSSRRTTTYAPAVTTTGQRPSDTAHDGSKTDPQAQPLAALAASGRRLSGTTGLARQIQLRERAQLWERLAQFATPTCAQAYRNAASVCRQEADTLNTSEHGDLNERVA